MVIYYGIKSLVPQGFGFMSSNLHLFLPSCQCNMNSVIFVHQVRCGLSLHLEVRIISERKYYWRRDILYTLLAHYQRAFSLAHWSNGGGEGE